MIPVGTNQTPDRRPFMNYALIDTNVVVS